MRRNKDYLPMAYYTSKRISNWNETNRSGSKFVGDFSFFITLSACIFGLIIQQAIAFMWRAYYV